MGQKSPKRITAFSFETGTILADKYVVLSSLGSGWEGEVYRVRELSTGVARAVKVFFPHRNRRNRATQFHARKLHKLRHCPILIQYHTQERIFYRDIPVTCLVSEYVEGELLGQFLKRQPGKRLRPFEALHLLYALARGLEPIHAAHEYHGDLHSDNIIIRRRGIALQVKLVDMFNLGGPHAQHIGDDVCDLVRVFYDALGGARFYARHPPEIKQICCGLKRTLILKKYRTARHLRRHLETFEWDR